MTSIDPDAALWDLIRGQQFALLCDAWRAYGDTAPHIVDAWEAIEFLPDIESLADLPPLYHDEERGWPLIDVMQAIATYATTADPEVLDDIAPVVAAMDPRLALSALTCFRRVAEFHARATAA